MGYTGSSYNIPKAIFYLLKGESPKPFIQASTLVILVSMDSGTSKRLRISCPEFNILGLCTIGAL